MVCQFLRIFYKHLTLRHREAKIEGSGLGSPAPWTHWFKDTTGDYLDCSTFTLTMFCTVLSILIPNTHLSDKPSPSLRFTNLSQWARAVLKHLPNASATTWDIPLSSVQMLENFTTPISVILSFLHRIKNEKSSSQDGWHTTKAGPLWDHKT